ncbi:MULTISPECIES: hypothetical protein [unclassified Solwaraspora]|uniref:hypothetical protein n=1 Tax=unclassified Solwaraspora TaxID=2627926 RepID=UPI00248D1CA0|nr:MULTISPECIES: hypothetical protein [unclassified Solwaraspora]WBB96546.1 hypothetical protein O7553_25100 [Solwaraspora sp. WMMA2059]WBC19549.1 hypothetical protein O7543_22265 [Solwaraspora sp. WMMA2080]WJK32867.1 hypothetical protein O7610_19290 [Solwaraspora sp. WMMA2065]
MSLTPPTDSSAGALTPRQLSLFGVAAADPTPGDLAGLLAGPGRITRMGGTVRVSVDVEPAWRVHVLVAEFRRRGLAPSWRQLPDGRLTVRTAYTAVLARLGAAWLHPPMPDGPDADQLDTNQLEADQPDADQPEAGPVRGEDDRLVKRPPTGFHLAGQRLRLWAAAAGARDPLGYRLRLAESDSDNWPQVGAALAAIGLPAVLLDARSGGPAYRIVGRRRLTRLAELLGDRPPAAPEDGWA